MTSKTNESFVLTREGVEAMGAADAGRYVRTQQAYFRETLKRDQNATDRAAYATFIAEHRLGLIFQPRGTEGAITGEAWAERFGKSSKSLTTGWRTLGHALMVVGLDPTGDTYIRMRNSNAYAYAEVKDAVMAEGATEETIVAVLNHYVGADGKRLVKPRAAQPPTGDDESGADGAKQDDVPVAVQFLAAVTFIEEHSGDLSLDEWADMTSRIETAISKENTLRAHALKQAARKSSTKKAAAKAS